MRPYNVSRVIGQDVSDCRDIADWLGQSDTATTRYHGPVLNSRMRAKSERLNGRGAEGARAGARRSLETAGK